MIVVLRKINGDFVIGLFGGLYILGGLRELR